LGPVSKKPPPLKVVEVTCGAAMVDLGFEKELKSGNADVVFCGCGGED
jgi:hypothetical protein